MRVRAADVQRALLEIRDRLWNIIPSQSKAFPPIDRIKPAPLTVWARDGLYPTDLRPIETLLNSVREAIRALRPGTPASEQPDTLPANRARGGEQVPERPERWRRIQRLGAGGQGEVYLVVDEDKAGVSSEAFIRALRQLTAPVAQADQGADFQHIRDSIVRMSLSTDPACQGALKILRQSQDARDPENAKERLHREIQAMRSTTHANLLRILDADPQSEWYVSEYHPRGTLSVNAGRFRADARAALNALRPLVEGVAELHRVPVVHRDIKPDNIFIARDGRLILGDFGLVYFGDKAHTRLSRTLENVGTWDWMPAWAQGMRIEDIRPTFDVFSLGKTLWYMVSGLPRLPLWYYRRPENDLELLFPGNPDMGHLNELLSRCVVEEEKNCLPDADALLRTVDSASAAMTAGAESRDGIGATCRVCGRGKYQEEVKRNQSTVNYGLEPRGSRHYRVLLCPHCGNVQLFLSGGGFTPEIYKQAE